MSLSLGEQPHGPARCDRGGRPHLGPCVSLCCCHCEHGPDWQHRWPCAWCPPDCGYCAERRAS